MRAFIFITVFLIVNTTAAQAGFMDRLQQRMEGAVDRRIDEATRKVENKVNNTVDEGIDQVLDPQAPRSADPQNQPIKKATPAPQPVTTPKKITNEFQNSSGVDGDWNIAPPGSLRVRDLDIKGVQLGMPEILVKETLTKAGFEQDQLYQFSKEIRLINGVEKEVTRADHKGASAASLGPLVKRYIITIQTVEPSAELLSELGEPLRGMIDQARKILGSRPLYLVYHIEYTQIFGSETKQDISALKGQIEKFFGNPTYQPMSIHRRLGSAFGTDETTWLIYHDASLVPVQEREYLMSQVKGKSDEASMLKKAFQHPCGARNRASCVNAGLIGAFPDSLELRLEAAKIIYSPVMMVHFQGSKITTLMEWAYISMEKSIREYFAKTKAQAAKPTATLDF